MPRRPSSGQHSRLAARSTIRSRHRGLAVPSVVSSVTFAADPSRRAVLQPRSPAALGPACYSSGFMDFRPTEEQELLRRSVREFAETEIRPHVREWDEAQHFPTELMPKLAALGLLGIQFPEQYGGAGMSAIDYCICIEELARVDPARRAVGGRAQRPLLRRTSSCSAPKQQKQKYLVPLARGEKIGAWGLTESTSGSDAAGMRTTAARAGDCWVLNGSKTFTTHGRVGDVMVVMAVTDRAAGTKGISAFIVEQRHAGHDAGQEGRQARDARERHERGAVRELPHSRRSAARRGGAGLRQHDAGARCRPHRHRRACGRPRAGRVRGGAALRAASARRSARRSAASRRFSGSSPTTRRASRRRGC